MWSNYNPLIAVRHRAVLPLIAISLLAAACSSDAGSADEGTLLSAGADEATDSSADSSGSEIGDTESGSNESGSTESAGAEPAGAGSTPTVPPAASGSALSVTSSSVPASPVEPSSTVDGDPSTTPGTPPDTTAPGTEAPTSSDPAAESTGSPQTVRIRFESTVADVTTEQLRSEAMAILNDPRGWIKAGFSFVADDDGPYRVVLAEGPEVDRLCLPLMTYGKVSCQNGPVVALNADRWRIAVDHWELDLSVYRGYLINHEVGHLIGQRHPKPRCPVAGRPAGVMEQQTAGLEGCIGNPWPRDWEIGHAAKRPVVYAPLPDWGPDPVPSNLES